MMINKHEFRIRIVSPDITIKTPTIIVILAILLLAGLAGCGKQPQEPERMDKGMTIVCQANAFSIDGQVIGPPYTKTRFANVLGKPARSFNKANDIDTWDALGVYAYAKPGEEVYHTFGIAFGAEDFDYYPKQFFTGSLSVNDGFITSSTTKQQLLAAGYRSEPDFHWLCDKAVGSMSVTIEFSEMMELVAVEVNFEEGREEQDI